MDSAASEALDRARGAGEREFREIADFAPVMIWRSGPDQLCDWFNKPWLAFTGRSVEQEIGAGWIGGLHPDDHPRCLAVRDQAFAARRVFNMEYRMRRHDGEYRWLLDNGAPYQRDGRFAGYLGSCIDITAHRELEQRQQRRIDELDHRVQNTLAIVQSIARQSLGGVASAQQHSFDGRLQALSAAHDLLTRQSTETTSLQRVVAQVVAAYRDPQRIGVSGPDVQLAPRTAVSLAIAMHELFTNALKFGALSGERGRVDVGWRIAGSGTLRPRLQLHWRESGGPVVSEPSHRGFGMRMLERGLARELAGTVKLYFAAGGLDCRVDAPLPALNPDSST